MRRRYTERDRGKRREKEEEREKKIEKRRKREKIRNRGFNMKKNHQKFISFVSNAYMIVRFIIHSIFLHI